MRDRDKIIIKKIIGYIDDIEEYVQDLESEKFFNDKKQ